MVVLADVGQRKSTCGRTNRVSERNTIGAPDPADVNDGADVAGEPDTGGTCTSSLTICFDGTGGLDQNIYSATITP